MYLILPFQIYIPDKNVPQYTQYARPDIKAKNRNRLCLG